MDIHEKVNRGYYTSKLETRDLRREEQRQLDAEFRRDLYAEYNVHDAPEFAGLYSLAWDVGHSNGYGEVVWNFGDLIERIITPLMPYIEAGRKVMAEAASAGGVER